MQFDVCVIGGCGHVGLPLALCFANEGRRVAGFDVNSDAVAAVAGGQMPFQEEGGEESLSAALASGNLRICDDPEVISSARDIILTIGTPVDRHLNPSFAAIQAAVEDYLPYFRNGQLLVLRSTVYPGTSERVYNVIRSEGPQMFVAFCPERIAQGQAIRETYQMPQIVSAFSAEGMARARELFEVFGGGIIELAPLEAELCKLFTNSYRYITFAVANQFYAIANDHGVDYYRLREAITKDYPRASDLPSAGFAAGPCLFKDTMQLGSFYNNSFFLGHAAMLINEGLPGYIVGCLRRSLPLREMTVGILGMAFKADSDDARDSLAYKLRKILELECKEVVTTDPYVSDERLLPLEEVVERSDLLIVGAPHSVYREVDLQDQEVVDIWNCFGRGGLICP